MPDEMNYDDFFFVHNFTNNSVITNPNFVLI